MDSTRSILLIVTAKYGKFRPSTGEKWGKPLVRLFHGDCRAYANTYSANLSHNSRIHHETFREFSMAKRFTDTDKWKKGSFSDLSLKMKLVWIYLCDNCDHAGIWDPNFKLMSFQIGETITEEEFFNAFGDKIQVLSTAKYFIESFVEFQYGDLNSENRAHLSVISRLKKEGAKKGLTRSLQGRKDKDKDKDKEMDKEKDKEGECEGKPNLAEALEKVYQTFPRKEGKSAGMKTLLKQLEKRPDLLPDLEKSVFHYAALVQKRATETEFIKLWSTFAAESVWRDFVDRPRELDAVTASGESKESWTARMVAEIEAKRKRDAEIAGTAS
jgi:hypothetical protein